MKTSELIQLLKKALENGGDPDVMWEDSENLSKIGGVNLFKVAGSSTVYIMEDQFAKMEKRNPIPGTTFIELE